MEYIKFKNNGKLLNVLDLEECFEIIRERNKDNEKTIMELTEENRKLKDEHYKDNELQVLKSQVAKLQDNLSRGFDISEEEDVAIKNWEEEHVTNAHNGRTYAGAIGGRLSYHFTPTSIGTIGVVKCGCGAEFCFRELL